MTRSPIRVILVTSDIKFGVWMTTVKKNGTNTYREFVTGQANICRVNYVLRTVTKEGPSYRVLCGEIQHIRLARVVLPYSIRLVALTGGHRGQTDKHWHVCKGQK